MKNIKYIAVVLCFATIGISVFNACQKEDLKQIESKVNVQKDQTQKDYYHPDIDTTYYYGVTYIDYSTCPPTMRTVWGWVATTHSVFNYVVGSEIIFFDDNGEPSPEIHLNLSTNDPGIKGELNVGHLCSNYQIVYVNISPNELEHYLQMTVDFLNEN
ncbi:MAG: hypothetical protein GX292_02015 [Bacteroidales bacterium]|jgi:hypothetical protein|nr:hypothetical protein [Bacteroidales bacterium]